MFSTPNPALARRLLIATLFACALGPMEAHAQPAPTAGDVISPGRRDDPAAERIAFTPDGVVTGGAQAVPQTPGTPWWKNITITPSLTVQVAYTPWNQMPYDKVVEYPGGPQRERNFALRGGTFGLNGQLFFPWIQYVFAAGADIARDGQLLFGLDTAFLRAYWMPYEKGESPVVFRHGLTAGAMRIPFSRQSLMSEPRLQFVNRAIVVEQMDIRRDIGATFDAEYDVADEWLVLGFRVGVFNGQGDRQYIPDNNSGAMFVGRARIDLFSRMNDAEGDDRPTWLSDAGIARMLSRKGPQLSFGGSFLDNNGLDRATQAWGADAELRWFGFSVHGEYLHSRYRPKLGEALVPDQLAGQFNTRGYYIQTGYYLWPEHLQVAFRYERYTIDLLYDASALREFESMAVGATLQQRTRYGMVRYHLNWVHRNELQGIPAFDNDSVTMQLSYQY
jgi:hypothetical protein